jgi:hypothetical protein
MNMNIINRKSLTLWLKNTAAQIDLVAPRDMSGVLLYRKVSDISEIVWDYHRPVSSAKEFFFPSTERLLTIEKKDQAIKLTETLPDQEQVIFGVRPCDARGITALDALFINSDPVDLNYARRRQNSIIIGIACSDMGSSCFCTSTGGSPDDPTGMDIILKEMNGDFEVQVITEKGIRIAKDEWGIANFDPNHHLTPSPVGNQKYSIPEKPNWASSFNNEFWSDLSERCLSCRICAYVCPTCRCFDLRDEVNLSAKSLLL